MAARLVSELEPARAGERPLRGLPTELRAAIKTTVNCLWGAGTLTVTETVTNLSVAFDRTVYFGTGGVDFRCRAEHGRSQVLLQELELVSNHLFEQLMTCSPAGMSPEWNNSRWSYRQNHSPRRYGRS